MRLGLLVLLLALAHSIVGQELRDPIQTRNHRAISLMFLRMPLGRLPDSTQAKGEWSIDLTIANDLRRIGFLDEDAELDRISIGRRWSLGADREVWLEVPILARGSGFLDELIDWWHRNVLRWTDPARDFTPPRRSTIALAGEYSFGSASGLGDVTIGATQAFGPRLSASAALKLPTGDPSRLLGSGSFDAGLSVDYRAPIVRRWSLHAQVGLVAQGAATRLPSTRGLVDQEALAVIYARNSRDTWIFQWQSERSPIVTGVSGADATHRLITIGYRRRLSDRETLELFFSEDRDLFNGAFPEGANIGPDFTGGIRYRVRF
ncbi:MAG TPA: DUF3187 family protein [Fimbriimonadaceae bacterium]|nr:DUF3187 family protein [Fimbriimonadaceae bacterium]HRJ95995.1 DUF3187 family protein [Fimbriimonadaceae bacterium]